MGKTIKEKAIIAAADDRQVVITTVAEGKYTGWITSTEDDSFAWEHPLGAKQHFQNIAVKDISFVGEPETKEEEEHADPLTMSNRVNEGLLSKIKAQQREIKDLEERLAVAEAGNETESKWDKGAKLKAAVIEAQKQGVEVSIEWQNETSCGTHTGTLLSVFCVDGAEIPKMLDNVHFVDGKQIALCDITSITTPDERVVTAAEAQGVKPDGDLSNWGWLARISRVRKIKVDITDSRVLSGFFVSVGSKDGRMYGMLAQEGFADNVRVYYDEIVSMRFGGVLDAPESQPGEPEDIAKQRWELESVEHEHFIVWKHGTEMQYTLANVSDLYCGTEEQTAVMTAAPELADLSRAVLECMGRPFDGRAGKANEALRQLLKKLGVMEQECQGEDDIAPSQLDEIAKLLNENADLKKQIAAHDGTISVSGARKRMRDAFKNDPEWKMTFVMNIEMLMYDILGSDNHGDRVGKQIAEKILDMVFEI